MQEAEQTDPSKTAALGRFEAATCWMCVRVCILGRHLFLYFGHLNLKAFDTSSPFYSSPGIGKLRGPSGFFNLAQSTDMLCIFSYTFILWLIFFSCCKVPQQNTPFISICCHSTTPSGFRTHSKMWPTSSRVFWWIRIGTNVIVQHTVLLSFQTEKPMVLLAPQKFSRYYTGSPGPPDRHLLDLVPWCGCFLLACVNAAVWHCKQQAIFPPPQQPQWTMSFSLIGSRADPDRTLFSGTRPQ